MSEPGPTTQEPYPSRGLAWWTVVVLMTVYIIGYIDRQALTLMIDMVKADLGASDSQMGFLNGSFGIFYAVAGLPIAHWADRHSRRAIISIGLFSWTIMTAACGLAQSYWQLFTMRIGVGVGEATINPTAHSLLGDYFPRDKIPKAMSVFQIGAVTGSGLAFFIVGWVIETLEGSEPLTLPYIGDLFVWQETFLYISLPGLLGLLLLRTVKEPRRRGTKANGERDMASLEDVFAFYKRNWKTIVTHHLGFSSLAIMGFGFVGWTAPFMGRIHGVSPGIFGQWFGIQQIIFGSIGVVSAALIAEYLTKKGKRDANIIAGMLGGIGMIPVGLLTPIVPSEMWAWILLVPVAVFVNYPFGVAAGALPPIVPPNMRARVGAVYAFVVTIMGMTLGLSFTGMLTDYVFSKPEDVRYSLMVMVGVFGPIGVGLLWLGRKHYARSLEASDAWH